MNIAAAVRLWQATVKLLADERHVAFDLDVFERRGGENRIAGVLGERLLGEILCLAQPFVAIGCQVGNARRHLSGLISRLASMPMKPSSTKSPFDHRPVGGKKRIDVALDQHLPDRVTGGVGRRERILERIAHDCSRIEILFINGVFRWSNSAFYGHFVNLSRK
jgi:hypothetical protein